MATLASLQFDFRRRQVGSFIELCNSMLEEIVDEVKSDQREFFHVLLLIEALEYRFFSEPTKIKSQDLKTMSYLSKEHLTRFSDIIDIIKGESTLYPLPEFYVDGSGEDYQRLSLADKEGIKKAIQLGVATKIKNLASEMELSPLFQDPFYQQRHILHVLTKKHARKLLETSKPSIYSYFPDGYKTDPDIAAYAIAMHPQNLVKASEDIKKIEHITFSACIKDPKLFELADDSLRSCKRFVIRLIKAVKDKSDEILKCAHEVLRDDFEVAKEGIKRNPDCFHLLSKRLKNNRDMLFFLIKINPAYAAFASEDHLDNRAFILSMVKRNPKVVEFLPDIWKRDEAVLALLFQKKIRPLF